MLASAQVNPFTPGNIVVARVGDGSAPLSAAATEVFLDEYTPSGTLAQSVPLPTSVNGNNLILTASGNVTSELSLTRSADGHYLVLTGYSAAPGNPTVAVAAMSSIDITRVIGLIAADGSIDTSTSTGDAFDRKSICAAATVDGTSFYSVGGNSGVRYQTLGSYQSTQLNTAPANIRSINIANGNLYISTASSPYYGLSQVGTGLPNAAPQTVTGLPGFPGATAGASPYGFYFADLSADVPGVDVVYVADDRTTTGGIQKWSLVAGSWVLNGTITSTAAIRGLNGTASGATVSLVASSSSGLFLVTDNAGYNTAPSVAAVPAAIATAATNTAFRGIAFAPVAPAPAIASFTPASGPVGTAVTVTGTNFMGATSVTLNGVAVTGFRIVDAATITFDVPAGATSGLVAITTPGGTAISPSAFTVTVLNPAPTIASFTPVAGGSGTTVTITGTNLTGATAVRIGTVAITDYTVVSATTITLILPNGTGSVSGFVTVVTPSGTATSTSTFDLVLATLASQALPGLTVFPNPATDYITVELPQAGAATVALRDLTGRLVLAPVALMAHQPLRLPASLAAGMYLLEVQQGSVKAMRRVEKK